MATSLEQQAQQRRAWCAGILLAVVTAVLYWPTTHYGFILFDDGKYVAQNPHVTAGLTWAGIKWAFTTAYAANWHPLTWISHMLDCSLYGPFAAGQHLTNLLLHTLTTLFLFWTLKRMTGVFWRSWIVAALFGWHPLHVESVAWVAERKDVLSTFFLILTLWTYAVYAGAAGRRRKIYYGVCLGFFALGLMSKPMLVTVPFVLLLLDYWPLRRVSESQEKTATERNCSSWPKLILEKLPFFILAMAACVITIVAQRAGGAIRTVEDVSYALRVSNALTAYMHYIGKAFWPAQLCIYYLLPNEVMAIHAALATLIILVISLAAICAHRNYPWIAMGWFWFLGTLVPVIGLVQVGSQAMADRYTYIPLIGLFIAVVWSAERLLRHLKITQQGENTGRIIGGGLAAVLLVTCLGMTKRQISFWRDDVALFQHAVNVTRENYFVEYELGMALANAGRTAEAIEHFNTSLRINSGYEPANYWLAIQLAQTGDLDGAARHFSEALKRDPTSEELHNNLGAVLIRQGKLPAATEELKQALQINPNYARAYFNYGNVLRQEGQNSLALNNYNKAYQLDAQSPETLDTLADFLINCPDVSLRNPVRAIELAQQANALTQNRNALHLETLAAAYAAAGDQTHAISTAETALSRAQEQNRPALVKQLTDELAAYRAGQAAK